MSFSDKIEIVIPYYRTYSGLSLLLRSIKKFTEQIPTINVIGFEKIDFSLDEINKEFQIDVNYINTGIENVELRMQDYLCNTSFKKSIFIHTDIEIIEFDPIIEILKISEFDENIGLIGQYEPGRFSSSYPDYYKPRLWSFFTLFNVELLKNRGVLDINNEKNKEKDQSQNGWLNMGAQTFPEIIFYKASLKNIECLDLPKSIKSKIVHYNSVTRRNIEGYGFLQNDDSIRSSQMDVISGIHNMRVILKEEVEIKNFIIIGLGEDGKDIHNIIKNRYPDKDIYFCERFVAAHNQKLNGTKIISFNEASHMKGKSFYYVCVPDYRWFTDKLVFAGLRYSIDYRVRLVHGNDYVSNEFDTFSPGVNNDIYVSNNNVILPSNNFIDSSDSGYLSTYGLYKYSISLFFIFLKKQINWLTLKKRSFIALKRLLKK
jgi:hypothetical protein